MASLAASSKAAFMVWTAASALLGQHTAVQWSSCFQNFPFDCGHSDDSLHDLAYPNGRTPGFLSRGMWRQAKKAPKPSRSTYSVQMRRAHLAKAEQRSLECLWNRVQRRRQPTASIPDGPAEPCVHSAAARIGSPVSWSNRTGWISGGFSPSPTRGSGIKERGWQRRIDAFCDVWLSSGSRRSLLLRHNRSRGRPGRRFPCEVFLVSEVRTISKKKAFMSFRFFSIPVPVQVRIYEPVHVERNAWN